MKTTVHVQLNFSATEWDQGRALLREVGRPDLASSPHAPFGYSLAFGSDEEFESFRSAAEAHGFPDTRYFVRRESHFTNSELLNARLLWMRSTRKPTVVGGPRHGTLYDLTAACKCCGTGAMQTSPLVVDHRQLPARQGLIQAQTGEWLISRRLLDAIVEDIRGITMWALKDARNSRDLDWVQLIADTIMPPFASGTTGVVRERACMCCDRDGYFHTATVPFEPHYRDESCNQSVDLVATFERFGNSRLGDNLPTSHFAYPLVLVSCRLFNALRKQRTRGLGFTPVACDL